MSSIKKLNPRGFAHVFLLLLVVVVVGIVGAWYVVSSKADTISFTYLGTHPQAVAQPTSMGKTLITLKGFNNKIYAGFGDYSANTGPIALTPFDPQTNTFASAPEYTQNTQMIGEFRTINNKLYSPSTDLRGSNFAVADLASGALVWKDYSWGNDPNHTAFMIHVFDMNTVDGSDIWMAGSSNQDATVFRSTDGGANWTEMQRKVGDASKFFRYYGVVTLGGKAYVQSLNVDNNTNVVLASDTSSQMWSNGTWSRGPSLLSQGGYVTWHPSEFAGKAIYFTWASVDSIGSECLKVFNGSSVTTSCPGGGGLTDYAIDGNTLYGVNYGQVYSTTDLRTWSLQGTGPSNAVSITVMNGKIYLGTTDSKLYSASVNPAPPTAGGTTSGGGSCTGKKCTGGGGTGGGGTTCHGKKCQTATGATN